MVNRRTGGLEMMKCLLLKNYGVNRRTGGLEITVLILARVL